MVYQDLLKNAGEGGAVTAIQRFGMNALRLSGAQATAAIHCRHVVLSAAT
jgi:hypothetical protein